MNHTDIPERDPAEGIDATKEEDRAKVTQALSTIGVKTGKLSHRENLRRRIQLKQFVKLQEQKK